MKQFSKLTVLVPAFLLMLVFIIGCKKNNIRELTTEDTNIVDYMRKYPDQFSEFVKILDRTHISPFLNAYGTYTVFAPTNDAIKLYLQQIGKSSTDELDSAALLSVVRMHIIQDTISTSSFTDGKLANPTMYGQYIITGVNSLGVTVVNRQANITQSNILTGNGYIHVIDHVLQPARLTAAKMIEQNPKLSIFTQALKATGFYDSLNITNNPDTTRRWLTVLAEPDSVLKTVGINSYADLVKRYNNTGDAKNTKDSLYLYVAYHILPGVKYVADIVQLPSHPTLAPLSVVTTSVSNDTVLLNETTFNDVHEAGIPIDRANSDNSTTNGVVHLLKGDIYLKIRVPVRVDFDLAAQPEIMKLTSVYRKPGAGVSFSLGQLQDVTWQNANLQAVNYYCEGPTGTNFYWKNDGFGTNLRFGNSAANNWTEFVTPLIVAGRYKIWFCYRRANMGAYTQISFDGQPTSRIVDFTQGFPSGASTMTDAVLEAQNLKRYSYENPNGNNLAQLAGVVDVPTTDRHRIRLQAVRDNGSGVTNAVTLDFIQFIPINDVQYGTRYSKDGTVYQYP
jgi:uncharacterized surface protein with fasciclin (FAS1) repeats